MELRSSILQNSNNSCLVDTDLGGRSYSPTVPYLLKLMERTISTLDPDVKISVNGTIPTDVGTKINKVTDLFNRFPLLR